MAMRRRIKPTANLMVSKRKTKTTQEEKLEDSEQIVEQSQIKVTNSTEKKSEGKSLKASDVASNTATESSPDKTNVFKSIEDPSQKAASKDLSESVIVASESPKKGVVEKGSSAESSHERDAHFKFPKRIDYNHSVSCTSSVHSAEGGDDDEGANIMQMDLQKSTARCPLSPTKQQIRQRIKVMPIFTQRRNSIIVGGLSIGGSQEESADTDASIPTTTTTRRERHHSGSYSVPSPNLNYHAGHVVGTGRIRTESSSSAFSDSYSVAPSHSKTRKTDEHNQFRNQSKRDFEARFSNGVPEKSSIKMFDLIYYNPVTNPMDIKPQIKRENSVKSEQGTSIKQEHDSKDTVNAFPVPQLKLTADGEMIIDEKSLEIESTRDQEARKILANSSLIYMNENSGMNGYYKRHSRTKEWPADETIRFYRCLQTAGTDFSMMVNLFKNRTRRDLKLKFKREERKNPALVKKALLYPRQFNVEELKNQFDTEEREKELEERKWKELQAEASKPFKKVHVNTSRAARALTYADEVYKHESVPRKRKYRKRNRQDEEQQNQPDENQAGHEMVANITKKRKTARRTNAKLPHELKKEPDIKAEPEIGDDEKADEPAATAIQPAHHHPSMLPQIVVLCSQQTTSERPEVITCDNVGLDIDDDLDPDRANLRLESDLADLISHEEFESISEESVTACQDSSRTMVDMDNGKVMVIGDGNLEVFQDAKEVEEPLKTLAPHPAKAVTAEDVSDADEDEEKPVILTAPNSEYNAEVIEEILTDIADGNLVVVSTLDPKIPDQVVNEIYMVDKDSGELCEEPLEIPRDIIDAILEVMV